MYNKTLAEISHRASLILAHSNEKLAYELKALYARNSAKGSLKSGATIKESARIARASIQDYFAELEKFVRQCPNGNDGSDSAIINAVADSTASLITSINEQLTATAALAGDATLVRHIQLEISEELSASQELFRSNLRAHWSKTASPRFEKDIFIFEVMFFILTAIFVILWVLNPSGSYERIAAFFGLGGGTSELVRRWLARRTD